MKLSQLLPVLVQYFKQFKWEGEGLSQTAITATLHFSDETHANGYDPEREVPVGIIFHKTFHCQTGTAYLNGVFW